MASELGALSNPIAALVMAVLLILLVGSATLAYLARSVSSKLECDRRRREQARRHAA